MNLRRPWLAVATSLPIAIALYSQPLRANVPEECVQSPARQTLCPHTLYRVAATDVPALAITAGDMVCLCLTDLTDLPADEQPDAFIKIADAYAVKAIDLYTLLEIKPPRKPLKAD